MVPYGVAASWKNGWIFKLAQVTAFESYVHRAAVAQIGLLLIHIKVPCRVGVSMNITAKGNPFKDQK